MAKGVIRRSTALPLALLLLAACRGEAPADELAAVPSGPVVDEAEIIPPDGEARLDASLRRFWESDRIAIVVTTIQSLEGATIEDYAFETFNNWGVGNAETDKGVLIVVATEDMQARIEVGCGLESVLTDEAMQLVMHNRMVPEFREGNYLGGINAGVDGIVAVLDRSEIEPGPTSELCLEQAA